MSKDHKPENPEETRRIQNAGYEVKKELGCFRIVKENAESSLNVSRTLGDFSYKDNKNLSADYQAVSNKADLT